VRAAQTLIRAGKDWVVDMDITQFFDRVNHDILMHRLGGAGRDSSATPLTPGNRYGRSGH
jgi:RNA-directed DNA polymerase